MGKKKANGEGTIFQRPNGLWAAQITIGRDPTTGKLKRMSYSGKTRKEVQEKVTKALADMQQGVFVEPTKLTVGEWLDIWLAEYKKPCLRPLVWESYEVIVRVHLKPAIGGLKLKDLRPERLQHLYNEKSASGLSASTVKHIHLVIHGALEQAMKNGLVVRNVSEATTLPRGEKKDIRALSLEEEEHFLEVLGEDRLGPAFITLLGTGLRRGELLALRWEDVDLSQGILHVKQDMVRTKSEGLIFQAPKTAKSRRTIPLPEEVVAELKRHKARQNEEKLALGPAYQDNNLVFTTEWGTPIEPRNFNRKFYQLRQKAGIEGVNLHALRHTYATRLLEKGVSMKAVQELLGHSKYGMTADIYSHVSPKLKREAVAELNGILSPKKKPSTIRRELNRTLTLA